MGVSLQRRSPPCAATKASVLETDMGYFSNGTEGECYYDQYCSRCIHNGDEDGPYCPVWALHKEHNYAECNN